VLLVFGVPRIEAIFLDFAIPLPRFTKLVIEASHRLISLRRLLPVLLPFLAGADWFVMDALSRRRDVEETRFWARLTIAIPLLMIVLAVWALSLPLFTIETGLTG